MRIAAFIAFLPLLVACSGSAPDPSPGGTTTGSATTSSGSTSTTSSTFSCTGSCTFVCGSGTCDLTTQICETDALDEGTGGISYEYSCLDLPAACRNDHTCKCIQQNGVSFIGCGVDSDGAIGVSNDLP